jgi:hypothetical protein
MGCMICTRPDVKEINLALLQRAGRRTGVVVAMAKKLGCSRQVVWRHRKEHLKLYMSKRPENTAEMSFEERAALLGREADRLQCQCENGAPRELVDQALKSLTLRMRLLEMEARFAGRPLTQQREEVSLEDPEEEAQAAKEFAEVVGGEK